MLCIPLNPYSSQPIHVHWWPVGVLSRLARNASHEHEFRICLFDFSHKLAEHRLRGEVIARVLEHANAWYHLRSNVNTFRDTARKLVLVLPFHRVWESAGFCSILKQTCLLYHDTLFMLHRGGIKFESCWKCNDPTSKIMFRRCNMT